MVEGLSVSLWRKGVQLKVSEVKIQNSLGGRKRRTVQVRLKPYPSRHSFKSIHICTQFVDMSSHHQARQPRSRSRDGHIKEWGFGREKGVRIFMPSFSGGMVFLWDRGSRFLPRNFIEEYKLLTA